MSCNIVVLPSFSAKVKKLAKKYNKIKADLQAMQQALMADPKSGVALSYNCYKMRVANSSTSTGKRGGFRVVYYFLDSHNQVFLMTIYAKGQKEILPDTELLDILKKNGLDK